MKVILNTLIFCCILVVATHAQQRDGDYNFSNVNLDRVDLGRLRQQIDSVKRISTYDSLQQLYRHASDKAENDEFAAFVFGYQQGFASLGNFRRELVPLGFGELSDHVSSVVLGFEFRSNRFLLSYLFAPSFKKEVSNTDTKMKLERKAFQIAVGYDLIPHKRFDFYPQLSLGLQNMEVDTRRTDANVTTVPQLINNPVGTSLRKSAFILGFGAEFDYRIGTPAPGGIAIGLRYEQLAEVGDGRYRINNVKSDFRTSDKIATSAISFVVKFYQKK